MSKIDFDDLSSEQPVQQQQREASEQEGINSRIEELRLLGKEPAVSPDEAMSMDTSVLVMSIVKFPELIGELAMGASLSAGNKEVFNDILNSAKTIGESLTNCGAELDARIPARTAKDTKE
jgi:secreted Zn-dependent insulinase-like peptidase